ncbi:type II toxin-antitoxin system RelE/ParE family toxin [Neorhizobium sp. P12A]|uniref:type II toxin-antitoxin system RelE/ParE family toxin n=1 Tax=Neorhizobium sp. P12A TaxID=2268027 RepID=UPI0011ECE35B|nr:type II toxin-antitoxin system RelE/ParE family toxin [Neorhizobium sp. P12A]KAA0689131.1 type II toxin-antitoxin system RelE/ParE family toxin [Neorhizobium sp. P12A]
MVYEIVRSAACDSDLGLILDHLVQSYVALGDPLPDAFERAVLRIRSIEADMHGLARLPHQGTLRPELGSGMRQVTKCQAVFYFEVDDSDRLLRILAVFFGRQDHRRYMLMRMSSQSPTP